MSYAASDEMRRGAAATLTVLANASSLVGHAMLSSSARGVLSFPPSVGVSAAATVSLLRAVANDHLQGFVQLLGGDVPRAASMATIVRSCIETWARARWLMSAQTPEQAEYRARLMVVEELMVAERRGVQMLNSEPIVDAIKRATAERDAIEGATPEKLPRYTELAVESLPDGEPSPSTIYSHLSGVAHGEVIFTSSLAKDPLGHGQAELALPAQNLASYCNWIFGASTLGMFELLERWDIPEDVARAFAEAVLSVVDNLPSSP